VNDVPIVDDVAVPTVPRAAGGLPARQDQDHGSAQQAFEPIVMEPDSQAVSDQPGRHAVEDALEQEAAAAGDGHQAVLMVIRPTGRQELQMRSFDSTALRRAALVWPIRSSMKRR
jgi:hypothetical protein